MGSSGGGQTTETSQTSSSSHPPAWEVPFIKAYLSALGGLVFPGMTQPKNYIPQGWNFGQGQTGGTPKAGGETGTGQGGVQGGGGSTGLDPILQSLFASPMISGSSTLQNWAQQNPQAAGGAMSPQAFNQLGQFYPSMMKGKGG